MMVLLSEVLSQKHQLTHYVISDRNSCPALAPLIKYHMHICMSRKKVSWFRVQSLRNVGSC